MSVTSEFKAFARTTKPCPECLESIPKAAKRCRACGSAVAAAALLLLLWPTRASAQDVPFTFPNEEEEGARALLKASAGFIQTTGNSQSSSITAAVSSALRSDRNVFSVDGNIAYARAKLFDAVDTDGDGFISAGELHRRELVVTNLWNITGRYDRFFSDDDAAYVKGFAGAERTSGKKLVAGGQVGYRRLIFDSDVHTTMAELGYDLTVEAYLPPTSDSFVIHSARVFVGETVRFAADSALIGGVELLTNLADEDVPNSSDATKEVGVLRDTRVNAKVELTTTLVRDVCLDFSFALRFDNNPAPLPALAGAPAFAPGFVPFADKTDTLTTVQLIINFL